MIKQVAYFIQNHIDPALDKLSDILWLLQEKGINFTKNDLKNMLYDGFMMQWAIILWQSFINILITIIVCFTAYKICVMSL